MGKISKEERIYLDGMAFAARIAEERGIDALKKEMEFRGLNRSVLNVRHEELIAVARGRSHKELLFVATAMADTMSSFLKLPPSIMKDYLYEFNARIELYRMDEEVFNAVNDRLTKDLGLNAICTAFCEDKDGGGKDDGNTGNN